MVKISGWNTTNKQTNNYSPSNLIAKPKRLTYYDFTRLDVNGDTMDLTMAVRGMLEEIIRYRSDIIKGRRIKLRY